MTAVESKAVVIGLVLLCCATFYGLGWTHGSSGNTDAYERGFDHCMELTDGR